MKSTGIEYLLKTKIRHKTQTVNANPSQSSMYSFRTLLRTFAIYLKLSIAITEIELERINDWAHCWNLCGSPHRRSQTKLVRGFVFMGFALNLVLFSYS